MRTPKEIENDWRVMRAAMAREVAAMERRYESIREKSLTEFRASNKANGPAAWIGEAGAGLQDNFTSYIVGGAWRQGR